MSAIAFHEKAGRSQVDSFWFLLVMLFLSSRGATVATLPSALLDERFVRSVQVGCSRFSRCCHLLVDLSFHLEDGSWPNCSRFKVRLTFCGAAFLCLGPVV